MVQCFTGGDYYPILSTAEVMSEVLPHTLVIILQKLDRFLRKATKRWKTVEGLREVGLLSLK